MVPTGWRSAVLLLLPTMRFTGFAPEALESWLARSEASALVVAGGFRQLHPGGRPLHGLLGRLGLGALHQNFAGALTRQSCGPFSCRNARMVSRPSLMGSGSPLAHDWSVGESPGLSRFESRTPRGLGHALDFKTVEVTEMQPKTQACVLDLYTSWLCVHHACGAARLLQGHVPNRGFI